MADTRIHAAGTGAILFDAGLAVQPGDAWFDPDHWRTLGKLQAAAHAGRGHALFVETPVGDCVLRHYHRGGMVAPLLGDRYLWNGRERTRGFAEFRLLAELHGRDLPVPQPVAARYLRRGVHYTADLITRRIESARTLAECLRAGQLGEKLAARVGVLVARFHAARVDHADLNAHNVLVMPSGLALVDFDRGRIRRRDGDWRLGNLRRLRRSLLKLGACDRDEARLDREIWTPLMRAYESAMPT
ncbi:MAG: 3-deoxy-D-manno-octulosonic acid kinase [Proteobacteria bacterium]|nr:3-deoxy-D-manno-octulosonic acid kinase [Pseudomonadota bacterium]